MMKPPAVFPIRIVNEKKGEVIDFWRNCSMRKAKKIAKGYDKRTKFTDLKIYRNVRNSLYV